ncbi:hypothetical protein JXA88_12065 [Candidatus Fermentibacteria bacterium]|nr:hypothetical protein [Candidatus Fermentibacteria bacterium]
MITYSDIEAAFSFVSSAPQYANSAFVSRVTGEVFYRSDMADVDEVPEDAEFDDDFVSIPHKNDLGLGRSLAFAFADGIGGELPWRVREIFRRRGAYGRFKDLLARRGVLETWYEFEARETKDRLLEWCKENSLKVEE